MHRGDAENMKTFYVLVAPSIQAVRHKTTDHQGKQIGGRFSK